MAYPVIEKKITINAPAETVWRVFTDPTVTRHMGGEYISDWKVGSPFGWKGQDGTMYTSGTILQIEPAKLLQHNLFDLKDNSKLLSVITYELIPDGVGTILACKEEINYPMSDEQFNDTSDGWAFALQAVKETAEKI